jgi:Mrp family chromosome partitioning ATPase
MGKEAAASREVPAEPIAVQPGSSLANGIKASDSALSQSQNLSRHQFISALVKGLVTPAKMNEDAVRLTATLRVLLGDSGGIVVFTGAEETDPVWKIASGISVALAQTTLTEVALIDARTNLPSLKDIFDIPVTPRRADELSEALPHQMHLRETHIPNLSLVPSGSGSRAEDMPYTLPELSVLFKSLRLRFRYVIITAPPLLKSAESTMIATEADGSVIVLSSGRHRREVLKSMKRELDSLKGRILGVVLCQSSQPSPWWKPKGKAK